jgi:hypothetical protein
MLCCTTDGSAMDSPPSAKRAKTRESGEAVDEKVFRKLSKTLNKSMAPTVLRSERAHPAAFVESDAPVRRTESANAKWKRANLKVKIVARMSTSTTAQRMAAALKEKIELELASEDEKENRLREGTSMLDVRLGKMGMRRVSMEGDGNCQFRAIAHNVYRDQNRHEEIRETAMAWIASNRDAFSIYFEDDNAFAKWVKEMKRSRTWGDELTLRAACDALGLKIHVVQSTADNWYLLYEPDAAKGKKEIFVSYISPVHYDAITIQ